jgi:hypothetical protein
MSLPLGKILCPIQAEKGWVVEQARDARFERIKLAETRCCVAVLSALAPTSRDGAPMKPEEPTATRLCNSETIAIHYTVLSMQLRSIILCYSYFVIRSQSALRFDRGLQGQKRWGT